MHSKSSSFNLSNTDLEDKFIARDHRNQQALIACDFDDARFLPIALKHVIALSESRGVYFVTERADGYSTPLRIKQTVKAISIFNTIRWVIRFMDGGENHRLLELNPYLSFFYESVQHLSSYLRPALASYVYQDASNMMKRLNSVVSNFRIEIRSLSFKLKLKAYLRNIRKNAKSFSLYIDKLFDNHAKLLLVRIDVGYGNEIKALVTYDGAKVHRDQLIKYVRLHYPDLVGYVWKLEFTPQKGYHYHLLFLFNGNQVRADILIARHIGDYWVNEITQKGGTYFNCNQNKKNYRDKLGIGMIKRHDKQLRLNMLNVINYLVKTDLYVKACVPSGVRTFGKGEVIEKKGRKANSV